MGLIFIIIFMNKILLNSDPNVKTVLFNDDTNILLTDYDPVRAVERAKTALPNLELWLKINHLTLNKLKNSLYGYSKKIK